MDSSSAEISIGDLAATLWSRRLLIICATAVAAGIGVAIAFVLPEKFESSVVLAPNGDDVGGKLGGAGALLSQFGGIASLGGLSLGGGGGRKSEAIATLQSGVLTEAFIRDNNLLPVLYEDDWNAAGKVWTISDPAKQPTPWKAEKLFREKIRSVHDDKKTGLITLTITWSDPQLAAKWAAELVARTNATLRTRAIAEAQRNLDYLNEQLKKTSVVELQTAIYGLIENQIKQVMVANGSEEFAFRIIDPARVSEKRSSPKRARIVILAIFLGLTIGCGLAFALPRKLAVRMGRLDRDRSLANQ